ncbi:unnamed protein product [Protopolystoma xenopodis]|uniref:Uncharacterized protein n=1 Tax=Protopolystoma xenopodis TaxID=117903 RepID=A0A3S5AF43_9PLAT|nr:unnamed protein product [Protopolystoma xenopodis]
MDYGDYEDLMLSYMIKDTRWLCLGLFMLIGFLVIASRSFLIPLVCAVGLLWSAVVSYRIYALLVDADRLPLINMLGFVLLLGLGTDDTLVYCQVNLLLRHTLMVWTR